MGDLPTGCNPSGQGLFIDQQIATVKHCAGVASRTLPGFSGTEDDGRPPARLTIVCSRFGGVGASGSAKWGGDWGRVRSRGVTARKRPTTRPFDVVCYTVVHED